MAMNVSLSIARPVIAGRPVDVVVAVNNTGGVSWRAAKNSAADFPPAPTNARRVWRDNRSALDSFTMMGSSPSHPQLRSQLKARENSFQHPPADRQRFV